MQDTRHLDPALLPQLQQWNGRTETLHDLITPRLLGAIFFAIDYEALQAASVATSSSDRQLAMKGIERYGAAFTLAPEVTMVSF